MRVDMPIHGGKTREEHQARHAELHRSYDELIADYLNHNPRKSMSNTSIADLMVWSAYQVTNPTAEEQ